MECVRGCMVTVGIGDEESLIPAVAAAGTVLCSRCAGRLLWRLGDVSDVAARARLAVVPGLQAAASDSERVSGSRVQSLPLNVTAMEVCDLVVGVIGEWCLFWGAVLGARVPAALRGAAAGGRSVNGVRAGTSADAVAVGLEEWVAWLRVLMPGVLAHPKVADFHDAVGAVVERAERVFPRDEPRVVKQRPRYCPVCELKEVLVSWEGSEPMVSCSACRWVFEVEWEELLRAIGLSSGRG